MAGDLSRRWNPLVNHLILIADELKVQGYEYDELVGQIIEPR
jgi:hypothetical protein